MPLQPDTLSLGLAKSIDQKMDDKVLDASQMSNVQDCVFDKDGQLRKRYGQTAQALTFQGDPGFVNPVAFTSGVFKTKCFAHENQLCVVNNGNLFSQFQGQNKWTFKGAYLPVQITSAQLDASATFIDVVTVLGVTVAVSSQAVYVVEESTKNIIAKTTFSGTEIGLKVIGFASSIYILSTDTATNNLYARLVNLTTGVLGATFTVASDFIGTATPPGVAITPSSSAIGEAAFIHYVPNGGNNKLVPFKSNGTLAALGAKVLGFSSTTAVLIEPTVNVNKVYVGGVIQDAGTIEAYTFTASAYTAVYSTAFGAATTNSNNNITMALSPINSTDLYVYFDSVLPSGSYNAAFSDETLVKQLTVSAAGVITMATYGLGYMLAGQCIRDAARKSIYLPVVYKSPLQTTLLLVDALEGRAPAFSYVIGKVLFGQGAVPTRLALPQTLISSGSSYRMVNGGYFIDFNFAPTYAPQALYTAKTTHLTGGMLWAYDGSTIAEHNFLIGPENFKVSTSAGATVAVTQVGDATHRQRQIFTCPPALSFGTPIVQNTYFLFSTTVASYYVWFTVAGVGVNPGVGGRTGIAVALLSTDTDEDVAVKVAVAVNASGAGVNCSAVFSSNTVIIQNFTSGAVTAPSVAGTAIAGSLAAGSYEYTIVYRWTDRNGNVYRSAPAVPKVVASAASSPGMLNIWAPPITNRNITDVKIEIYRSQNNVQELQLLTTLSMSQTTSRFSYLDQTSDVTLGTQAILYTNAGVLDNFSIGACTALSTFKNRLLVTMADDLTAIYYSRTNVIGEPINFSSFNALRYDGDGLPVTSHAQMDDKLVAFKGTSAFVTAGDGSNDLGQGETFQLPMRIPGDIGCLNPNSLISSKAGLLFQSGKGLYAFTRGLGMEYAGSAVDNFKNNLVSSAVLTSNYDHIIFGLQDSTTSLVYNQLLSRWDVWANQQSDSACLWQGQYVRALNSGKVFVEGTNFFDTDGSAVAINRVVETPWLKLKGLTGFQRIWSFHLLGEYKSAHTVTFNVFYDYVTTVSTPYTIDASIFASDPPYEIEVQPGRQKCEAIKVQITETTGAGTGECATWNTLDFYVGLKQGLNKLKAGKSI